MASSSVSAPERLIANIATRLSEMAAVYPDRKAVVFPERRDRRGRVAYTHLSYRQLDEYSDVLARGLIAAGIGPGTRAALLMPPSLDFFGMFFAMSKAGVVAVCVDPGIGLRRMGGCLQQARPEALVGVSKAHWASRLLGWARDSIRVRVVTDRRRSGTRGVISLDELERRGRQSSATLPRDVAPDQLAAVLFTSGSTGAPKGVVYTQANFHGQIEALREGCRVEAGDVDLSTFPLFGLFAPLYGMTSIIPDMDFTRPGQVDPQKINEPIENFGVTSLFGSPALLRRVGQWGAETGARWPTLRRVVTAGAPVPTDVLEQVARMLPDDAVILTPYGATEALPIATIDHRTILEETAALTARGHGVCVGRPVSAAEVRVIRISDEPIERWNDALPVEPGEIGEIAVRGPMVTARYFEQDEATALAKIPDGQGGFFHRMGDLGYQDTHGRIWFCGRKSQRVRCADGDRFTIVCEAVFNQHPKVLRTALVGVRRGETIEPVICVETYAGVPRSQHEAIRRDLEQLAATTEPTRRISTFLFHPRFPVDIRHNAKIGREQLTRWAEGQLR